MQILDLSIRLLSRLCRSFAKRMLWILIAAGRYTAMAMAGGILAGALMLTIGRLDEGGRTVLTVYAETASAVSGEDAFGKPEAGKAGEMAGDIKEGQLLAGETVAREVFALREARQQRQEDIRLTKENIQEELAKKEEIQEEKAQNASEVKLAGRTKSGEMISQEETEGGPGVEIPKEESRQASSVISYSQQDYEVLKRIVEAEAGVCDTKGRILVANVVINRVKSNEFPDTITGVVYQKSQFSPVSNGSLNSCAVTPETVEAVDRALAGEDYSQGALYFMNRRRSRSGNVNWFDRSLTFLFQHERHEFFK